ncbi:hypothetical protein [Marinobacter sp.]|uniref:hypothetical protein n=1 Tax=Marinobacter sp. TaxID=50741 RepID=UPI0035618946
MGKSLRVLWLSMAGVGVLGALLEEPKAALERLGWPVHSNPNPYRIPFYGAAFAFIAGILYRLFF